MNAEARSLQVAPQLALWREKHANYGKMNAEARSLQVAPQLALCAESVRGYGKIIAKAAIKISTSAYYKLLRNLRLCAIMGRYNQKKRKGRISK